MNRLKKTAPMEQLELHIIQRIIPPRFAVAHDNHATQQNAISVVQRLPWLNFFEDFTKPRDAKDD